jgi:hypothetical protein
MRLFILSILLFLSACDENPTAKNATNINTPQSVVDNTPQSGKDLKLSTELQQEIAYDLEQEHLQEQQDKILQASSRTITAPPPNLPAQ